MELRQSTKESYIKMLTNFLADPTPLPLLDITKKYNVDAKLSGFLKKNGLIRETEAGLFVANYGFDRIEEIINSFAAYRSDFENRRIQDNKDLEYYRANKDFLVDSRKTVTVSSIERDRIIADTKAKLVKEVAEYAAMAVRLGKTDIVGFITSLLNTK